MQISTIAVLLTVAAVASAFPQFGTAPKPNDVILREEVREDSGAYTLKYVTADETKVTEVGKLVPNNKGDDVVLIKEGSFEFQVPEGKTYTVNYVADQNGYRASGEHIL